MALIVRCPSAWSKGKWTYGKGSGALDDPCTFYFYNRGSDLCLYLRYKRDVAEPGITFQISYLIQGNWYYMMDTFNNELISTCTILGEVGAWKNYALNYPYIYPFDIPEEAELGKVEVYVKTGNPAGEAVFCFTNSRYPDPQPHVVDGFTRIPVGYLSVTIVGRTGRWKIYHEDEWRDSGDIVRDLGIGYYLITFEDVGGTKPDDVYLEVKEATLTESTISYPI